MPLVQCFVLYATDFYYLLVQGSQTHLGVRASLQDISQSAGRTAFRDDKIIWRSAVSSPSGVWGRAPAEIEFDVF